MIKFAKANFEYGIPAFSKDTRFLIKYPMDYQIKKNPSNKAGSFFWQLTIDN
jgi:hypothetical protein